MNQKKINYKNISTIYFGGGTPSIINNQLLRDIINKLHSNFRINNDCEITIESNPDDISKEKVVFWRNIGINRVSLGVQSFNNKVLKGINRNHDSSRALDAIKIIKNFYSNYSIDLMFGTPYSSTKNVKSDLEFIKTISPPHISIYNMTLEKKTVFYKFFLNNKLLLPSENIILKQYDLILNSLGQLGYENYEISNYSKPGFKSRHNSNYWNDIKYIGYGPSAHSYDKNYRYWNTNNNLNYIRLINKNEEVYQKEKLTLNDKINEYILTKIRTIEGIDLNTLYKKFQVDLDKDKNNEILLMKKNNLLIKNQTNLILTNKGKKIADYITEKFMY